MHWARLESENEVRLLTDLGCESLQSYYFSKPGPVTTLAFGRGIHFKFINRATS